MFFANLLLCMNLMLCGFYGTENLVLSFILLGALRRQKKDFYDIFVLQVLMDFPLQKQALSKSLVAYILNPFSGFSSITFPFSFE